LPDASDLLRSSIPAFEHLRGDFESDLSEVPGMLETARHVGALLSVVF
jgi:hypothetical protein